MDSNYSFKFGSGLDCNSGGDNIIMVKKYDFKKTLKKFGIDLGIVVLTGAIIVWQSEPTYIVLIPFMKAGLNYLKNRG